MVLWLAEHVMIRIRYLHYGENSRIVEIAALCYTVGTINAWKAVKCPNRGIFVIGKEKLWIS